MLNFLRRQAPKSLFRDRLTREADLIYAIGDVHGCYDELTALENLIKADAQDRPEAGRLLVLLGDYVDRGRLSAAVLDHLLAPAPPGFDRVALTGNHEVMMLDFLGAPRSNHDWLRFGGADTLASYGIDVRSMFAKARSGSRLSNYLRSYIPDQHLDLLRQLPILLVVGTTTFVHAGIKPRIPVLQQSEMDMLWMRHGDTEEERVGLVVHGHTPAPEPVVTPYRVCVDTGAFATGILTAARFVAGRLDGFLSTSAIPPNRQ